MRKLSISIFVYLLSSYEVFSYADANIKESNFTCIYPISFTGTNKCTNFYIFIQFKIENDEGRLKMGKLSIFAWEYNASERVTKRDINMHTGKNENLTYIKNLLKNMLENEDDYRNLSTSYEFTEIKNIKTDYEFKLPIYKSEHTIAINHPTKTYLMKYIHIPFKLSDKNINLVVYLKISTVENKLVSIKLIEIDKFNSAQGKSSQYTYMNCLSFISNEDYKEFHDILQKATRSHSPRLNKTDENTYNLEKMISLHRVSSLKLLDVLVNEARHPEIKFYRFRLPDDTRDYFENKIYGEIEQGDIVNPEELENNEMDFIDMCIHSHKKEPLGIKLKILIVFGILSSLLTGFITMYNASY